MPRDMPATQPKTPPARRGTLTTSHNLQPSSRLPNQQPLRSHAFSARIHGDCRPTHRRVFGERVESTTCLTASLDKLDRDPVFMAITNQHVRADHGIGTAGQQEQLHPARRQYSTSRSGNQTTAEPWGDGIYEWGSTWPRSSKRTSTRPHGWCTASQCSRCLGLEPVTADLVQQNAATRSLKACLMLQSSPAF